MKKKIVLVVDYKFHKKWFTGLAYSYLRAFKAKEFECELIEFDVNPYIYHLFEKYYPAKLKSYLKSKQKPIINYIKNSEAEFVFIIKGYYLLPETIELLKDFGKKVFCFYPDDPLVLQPSTSNKFVSKSIEKYNAYFIWSKKLIKPIQNVGCKNVFYLPFGADIDLLHPTRLDSRSGEANIQYDVTFIGNVDRERTDFINSLSSYLDDNFNKLVFGCGWENLNGFKVKGEALGDKFINTIFNSKINLNILRVQNKNSNNMRTFEIPAVGGFMLHEYSEEAIEFFEPGIDADYFKSPEECADKIKYYLKNDMLRQKIAKAGHEKVFSAKYLYTNRVDEIWQNITSLS